MINDKKKKKICPREDTVKKGVACWRNEHFLRSDGLKLYLNID